MIKLCSRVAAVVCSLVLASACSEATAPGSNGPPQSPGSAAVLNRALTPAELSVRDAANKFSFALWASINAAQPDTNVFTSPLSASFALGMTMNGADSITYGQMHSALQFGNTSLSDVNGGYKSLMTLLPSLDTGVTMQIANAIWYRQSFPVLPTFVDTTKTDFSATVKGLNFDDVSASLATINGWANSATNGRIPSVLDTITSDEMMFLINAIYFKAGWRVKFDPAKTTDTTFTSSTGASQSMKLMHRSGSISYAETAAYQAVDLPYGDSAFTMTVLLPKAGTNIQALAASLSPASWQAVLDGMRVMELVSLSLPKISLKYERRFDPDLRSLGMIEPFDPTGAHFTLMSPAPSGNSLFIGFVKQDTFLAIDEEGTEAAAVTTVGAVATSAPIPVTMRVDHPYIIVIRERLTGTVLFMGKVVSMP
jgi:serpin B